MSLSRVLGVLGVLGVVCPMGTLAAALDDEMAELAAMVRDNCAAESGVRRALLERVDGGASLAEVEEPVLKCYIKCTMETTGMLADGAVDVEAVLALLPDDLRHKNEASLRACGSPPGEDVCDVAYRTQLCWQQANPKDYFLI